MNSYVDTVYAIVKRECRDLDAINGAYICKLVGDEGLRALIEAKLVETCGVVHGNQLYVLLNNDRPEEKCIVWR